MEGNSQRIGLLVMTAVALILGAIILAASAQQVGNVTNTITLENQSLGTMTNGTDLYVTSCRALSDVKIWNATGDVEMSPSGTGTSNYTVTNNALDATGGLSVKITPNVTVTAGTAYNKGTATIDGVCQPTTYSDDSGARAIAGIIIIMFAIALAVVALYPTMRERFF